MKQPHGSEKPLPTSLVLQIITETAIERGTAQGHTFGAWQTAKRRLGKGAIKAVCERCGMQAVALPHGEASATIAVVRYNPGLQGAALTEPCISTRVVDPPPGVLGLLF